jgi:hypothetical protein
MVSKTKIQWRKKQIKESASEFTGKYLHIQDNLTSFWFREEILEAGIHPHRHWDEKRERKRYELSEISLVLDDMIHQVYEASSKKLFRKFGND